MNQLQETHDLPGWVTKRKHESSPQGWRELTSNFHKQSASTMGVMDSVYYHIVFRVHNVVNALSFSEPQVLTIAQHALKYPGSEDIDQRIENLRPMYERQETRRDMPLFEGFRHTVIAEQIYMQMYENFLRNDTLLRLPGATEEIGQQTTLVQSKPHSIRAWLEYALKISDLSREEILKMSTRQRVTLARKVGTLLRMAGKTLGKFDEIFGGPRTEIDQALLDLSEVGATLAQQGFPAMAREHERNDVGDFCLVIGKCRADAQRLLTTLKLLGKNTNAEGIFNQPFSMAL